MQHWRAFVLGCSVVALAAEHTNSTAPHVIFMLGDEVGWNNVQWHSSITLSPNMAKLARQGVTLERVYAQVGLNSRSNGCMIFLIKCAAVVCGVEGGPPDRQIYVPDRHKRLWPQKRL